jgi:hypothetical protein
MTEEPGALDGQGKPVPQLIIAGTERSARQAAKARETSGHGRKTTNKPQREPGGMFADPASQEELF